MQYEVTIQYYHFLFDDAAEALAFATNAKSHYIKKRNDNDEIDIEIKLLTPELDKLDEE